MSTIYVLEKGEYSDRHIVALFSDKELADKAMILAGDDASVEEYELDSLKLPKHPQGCLAWVVIINVTDNSIQSIYQQDGLDVNFKPGGRYMDNSRYSHLSSLYMVNCWARDQEHAKKIALDKYYQWKYENLSQI